MARNINLVEGPIVDKVEYQRKNIASQLPLAVPWKRAVSGRPDTLRESYLASITAILGQRRASRLS